MSLSIHDIGFDSLDQLPGVDSLCLFVAEDERPLRGTAGYVDWRMCGKLSRLLIDRFFTRASDHCLLFPPRRRIAQERIFALRIRNPRALGLSALSRALSRTPPL